MRQLFTVLGATGFIGQRLVRKLKQSGAELWAPERQATEVFTRPLGVVFYCIGLTADFAQRPFDTVNAHICYLSSLLEKADFDHIVYLSSTRLYDSLDTAIGRGDTPLSFSPKNPRHLYDLSKVLGENMCLTVVRNRSSIARLACVFDTAPNSPGFLSELLQHLRSERTITLDSSPGYCRDYISLDDTVNSLIKIGEQRACDIFNVASGVNTYNQDIADTLSPLGVNITFSHAGECLKIPRCDINNLQQLGMQPANTLSTLFNYVRGLKN